MKKIIPAVLAIVTIILIVSLLYLMIQERMTGAVIKNQYTYTKAICTETNFCQDYEINCNNGGIVEMTPITGAFVQHNSNWQDPRENKSRITCE